MGVIWSILWISSAYLFPFYLLHSIESQPSQYLIANGKSNSWIINNFPAQLILQRNLSGPESPKFVCGFVSNISDVDYFTFLFGVSAMVDSSRPKLVWTSNGNKPVRENATLVLTGDGDLILKDVDGTLVWSTNTQGRSVAGLNLTESGNLVLFDTNNNVVWQSFDHPTDTLVLGQKLYSGKKLTASASSTNWSEGGMYSLSLTNEYLFAFIESDPSLVYFQSYFWVNRSSEEHYAILLNGSLSVFPTNNSHISQQESIGLLVASSSASSLLHARLDFDGHLRAYDWIESSWKPVADILTSDIGNCGYPLQCGKYGICSVSGDDHAAACGCPQPYNTKLSYFKETNDRQPTLGCSEIIPLSCKNSAYQKMVEIKNVTHVKGLPDIGHTDLNSCKLACQNNCSCKAAMFDSARNCYLASHIFSLRNVESDVESETLNFFLKVQEDSSALTSPPNSPKRKTSQRIKILGWSLGAFSGLLLIICIYIALSRKKTDADDLEEDYLNHVPGMPERYPFEELIAATNNFNKKLGQGGFGSVFEGTLSNGTMVAVKCLDGLDQIKDSFLSEVKTIGSIHHVNLVRLIGYCTKKSRKLLVYEFMCNGSLEKWIFHRKEEYLPLDWQARRMIILDIAKGLAYLHEECSQKIFHLDIKPQNILLDANFRAKVSDFGLSKLIDRDQSQVVTMMKGTPGYMAPEWLNSVITEKVDVYSFGVVVLEILCGRKNLDRSQPEEEMHLLSVFKKKAEQDQLLDMIDKSSVDMLSNGEEIIEMMKVAAWCLQSDFAKRPSMSVVVKVLEGLVNVAENLEYDFTIPPIIPRPQKDVANVTTPLLPSTLSGPR